MSESAAAVDRPELIKGRRAIVIDDAPTRIHGGMTCNAGRAALR